MQLEYVFCYICDNKRIELWAKENGYQMVKCTNCELVYLNPRPRLSEIEESTRVGMHRIGKGILNTLGRYSPMKAGDFIIKISELFPHEELKSKTCKWLDIGAGYGDLIQALTNLTASGSDLLGIEPCEAKVKKGKSLGIPLTNIRLSDVHARFTHVSLINVFSRLPNPIEFLSEIKSHMEPGGQLILVTGNGAYIPREEFLGSLYLPDHLSFIGEGHIKTIPVRAQYTIKTINRYRAGRSNESYFIGFLKNISRVVLGGRSVPLKVPETSRFRLLWVRAKFCN
ncbi:MAG: class I SAM-dependent methyltransferase [Promethearchaeota archaeon]